MATLRSFRDQNGKSQAEVAASVGISRSLYSMYELEIAKPPLPVALRLAVYFSTTVESLFGHLADIPREMTPAADAADLSPGPSPAGKGCGGADGTSTVPQSEEVAR